jgi:Tfp pilus assembly protein PilF
MKQIIFKLLIVSALLINVHPVFAQKEDADALHETARSFMRQGDFPNALLALDKALTIKPADVDLLKDKAFVYYLQRDFANAISLGKQITTGPDADVQSFQILGLSYKAIGEAKESDKMYKEALKKFPGSGAMYSEYGELLSENNNADAIKQWEKGIEVDPAYSGNYYFACKYYAQKGNIIWGLLYAEIFVNIESLSKRSEEVKNILFGGYKKLFSDPSALNNAKQNGNAFEKAVATNLSKLTVLMNDGVSPEALTALRARFILNWYNGAGKQYPFHLFENQRILLQEGYFDAYNQWLVGPIADTKQFQSWTESHANELKAYQQYQRSVLFKMPAGQYYPH